MSMGVNINNIYVNNMQNNLLANNKENNINKGNFLNMLSNLLLEGNSEVAGSEGSNTYNDLNIINLILGNNVEGNEEKNILNLLLSENAKVITKSNAEDNSEEANFKNALEIGSLVENYINLINIYNSMDNKENKEIVNDILNSNVMANNSTENLKSHNSENLQSNFITTTSTTEKNMITDYNVITEKLLSSIKDNEDKPKNDVNKVNEDNEANEASFEAQVAMQKIPIDSENNKVITVSDESNNIKSQALPQIKDKIVFMSEEGVDGGNGIKHVTMQLQPHNLGKVHIKMTFDNNKVTVEVKALNEETQKILASNIEELANQLNKTSDSVFNVIIKSNDSLNEQVLKYNYNADQGNEQQYLNQNNNSPNEHGRQRNHYYSNNNDDENVEDGVFSQLINFKNMVLSST